MATKTISITEDVYERLKVLKAPEESFSDELRRLSETKGNIMSFAGIWKDINEDEAKKMKVEIRNMRKNSRFKEIIERV